MRTERVDDVDDECQQDRDWIAANRALFWLVATVAYEEMGRGAIVVNVASGAADEVQTFGYFAEGELDLENEDLRRHVNKYDPDREFVIVLQKEGSRADVYCAYRPLPGWQAEMGIQTPSRTLGNEE